jgi:hypothetical protein
MLPNLLLIGAMKAGTTSLYEDLAALPDVFMCPEKEPNDLIHAEVETPEGRAAYAAKFPSQATWRGEASTAYTMDPTHPGVAARARRVLGPETRLIYLTRDPIARIVSHYHHLWGLGLETRSLNDAVLQDPSYLAYSRYDAQLTSWRATFPEDQILVLRFEDYVADKAAVMAQVCAFLDLPLPARLSTTHRNASSGKAFVPRGSLAAHLFHSPLYLHRVKPLIPTALKHAVKARLLPKTPPLPEALTPETRAILIQRLEHPCTASA